MEFFEKRVKNAIIWGAGVIGRKVYGPLTLNFDCNIIAYVDNDAVLQNEKGIYQGGKYIPVISPAELGEKSFDILFVAVHKYKYILQIKEMLLKLIIPQEKIVYLAMDFTYMDVFLDERYKWISKYAEWIKESGIEGNVAECGVFRGDSAKFINKFFPERRLYLFDTFNGFDERDVCSEYSINGGKKVVYWDEENEFSDTSIEFVMKKMTYPENVVLKKGYFPNSAEGMNEKFCFVNLDMDLYEPMLSGLRFFWDKMEKGGCILLHDYFLQSFPGVKLAVEVFERELGREIPKTPIGDKYSMALLKY